MKGNINRVQFSLSAAVEYQRKLGTIGNIHNSITKLAAKVPIAVLRIATIRPKFISMDFRWTHILHGNEQIIDAFACGLGDILELNRFQIKL